MTYTLEISEKYTAKFVFFLEFVARIGKPCKKTTFVHRDQIYAGRHKKITTAFETTACLDQTLQEYIYVIILIEGTKFSYKVIQKKIKKYIQGETYKRC